MSMSLRNTAFLRLLIVGISLFLVGCATRLAPPSDQAVVDGLSAANTEIMTFLASTSHGTEMTSFAAREEKYNALIGKFEALSLAAGARPMPSNKAIDVINSALERRGGKALPADETTPPSAHPLKKVAAALAKMRDTDRKQGLTQYETMAFQGEVNIYLDQALTYENFLQR